MTYSSYKVTKKNYSWTISQVDDTFLTFINQYSRTFFSKALHNPKMLNRRELHTYELGAYISAYTNIFENGTRFTEATMILNTTTSANNSNALVIAANYKRRDEDQKVNDKYIHDSFTFTVLFTFFGYIGSRLVHVHFLFTMIFKIVSFNFEIISNFEIAYFQIVKSFVLMFTLRDKREPRSERKVPKTV